MARVRNFIFVHFLYLVYRHSLGPLVKFLYASSKGHRASARSGEKILKAAALANRRRRVGSQREVLWQ